VSAAEWERDAALEVVRSALGAIREISDPQQKIDAAGQFARDLREGSDEAAEIRQEEVLALHRAGLSLAEVARVAGISKTRVQQIVQAATKGQQVTEQAVRTKPETIVAAIVTSSKGVLVGRRRDGRPLWTFLAGEHIDGETLEDTAVREVMEESGLAVRITGAIGERKHPRTRRWMAYYAAEPTAGTDAIVGDEEELAEVRWVSLAEADLLMGGTIFEPVHEYLRRTLKS
jgi:8-oxo-dGTP pyrophosphatase MutT (NUDIX family)